MNSFLKTLTLTAFLVLFSSHAGAAEYGTFESFYSAGGLGFWGWTAIIAGTAAVAAVTFFTFGGGAVAAPAWMAAVGTWIGSAAGYSGIAAANFGLALLGGGSIAAGGLGVAGGVTVLSAALTFSSDLIISYGVETALEKYSHAQFIKANKNMLTLPVPRNTKGGKAYKAVMDHLEENFNAEEHIGFEPNQKALRRAIEILNGKMSDETDKEYQLKDNTLLALLHLQTHNYAEARSAAVHAVAVGSEIGKKYTMAEFIHALAQLADPEKGWSDETLNSLKYACQQEPGNKFIPLMTGCVMDRMIYAYRHGRMNALQLTGFCNLITDETIDDKLAAQSLEVFITRCLVELKRTQQDIRTVAADRSLLEQTKVLRELKTRLERHKDLLGLLQETASPQVERLAGNFPEESKIKSDELGTLLHQYQQEIGELESLINS